MSKRNHSIRTALAAYFVLVAMIPLAAVTIFDVRVLTEHIKQDTVANNLQLASALAITTSDSLSEPERLLRQAGSTMFVDRLIPPNQTNVYLRAVLKSSPYFERISVVDKDFRVVSAAPYKASYVGLDLSGERWLRKARRTATTQWSSTFISPLTGQPTVAVGIPFGDHVLDGHLSLSSLSKSMGRFGAGESRFVSVLDENGTYIASPDRGKVLRREVDVLLNGQVWSRPQSSHFSFQDGRYLYNAVLLHKNRWAVVVTQPVDEAFAAVNRIRHIALATALLAIAVAVGVSIRSATKISGHLRQLVARTQAVTAGDYSPVGEGQSYREVNELAANFNMMTDDIRQLITRIEDMEAQKRRFYKEVIMSVTEGRLVMSEKSDLQPCLDGAPVDMTVTEAADAACAREKIRQFCAASGLQGSRLDDFCLGVGEAITNALKHGGGGRVCAGKGEEGVQVAIADQGSGIESLVLPKAILRRGFSTKPSLGLGYSIILQVADRVLLNSSPEGTTLVLIKELSEPSELTLADLPDTW